MDIPELVWLARTYEQYKAVLASHVVSEGKVESLVTDTHFVYELIVALLTNYSPFSEETSKSKLRDILLTLLSVALAFFFKKVPHGARRLVFL